MNKSRTHRLERRVKGIQEIYLREFPGSPVAIARTLCFHCRGHGFEPWSGNSDPASHVAKKKKKKRERDLFNTITLYFNYEKNMFVVKH